MQTITQTRGAILTARAADLRHIAEILEDFVGELVNGEPEPISTDEAQAIIHDFVAAPPRRRRAARAPVAAAVCRCDRAWTFERGHCCRCGHRIGRAA